MKWISIKKQMPEDCEIVLLYSSEFGVNVGHWNSGSPDEKIWWIGDMWISDITHWMPLPEGPDEV